MLHSTSQVFIFVVDYNRKKLSNIYSLRLRSLYVIHILDVILVGV